MSAIRGQYEQTASRPALKHDSECASFMLNVGMKGHGAKHSLQEVPAKVL